MQPFVATVALSTCVCWSLARVAVNELNWSRCCLGCGLVGAEGTMYYVGAWKEGRALLEIILGNAQACLGDSSYWMQLLWLTAAGAHADTRAGASSRRRDIVTHWQPVYSLCLWWSSHRPTRYSANRGLRSSGLLSSKVWLIYQARPTLAAFFTNNRRWVHFMSRYCNVRGKQRHRKNGLLGRFCKYSYCKQSR